MILFSDVHGNTDALRRVLQGTAGPWACAGDVLGSGGGNAECLELLRDIPVVKGNHEVDLLPHYRIAVPDWPLAVELEGALLTHTLIEETSFGPHFQCVHHEDQAEQLNRDHRLVFIGHTHLPGWWMDNRWHPVYAETTLELDPRKSYVINLGSLGEAPFTYVEWSGATVRWFKLSRLPLPEPGPSAPPDEPASGP